MIEHFLGDFSDYNREPHFTVEIDGEQQGGECQCLCAQCFSLAVEAVAAEAKIFNDCACPYGCACGSTFHGW